MILPLLSVVAVLGCLVPQEATAVRFSPVQTTIQYVFVVLRHGPRSPLYRPYPKHKDTEKHLKTFVGLRGVLTMYGKLKMYDIGKNLRDRYWKFLGDYREDRVWVTSRGASRNVMTAVTVMAGMLPPKVPILPEIDWQPIPAFATKEDKSFMFHDLEFKKLHECPKYKKTVEEFHFEVLAKQDWNRPFYRLLRSLTGNIEISSILTAFQVYDYLHSESMNGITLPDWALENQPSFKDLPIYPTLLRDVVEEWRNDEVAKSLLNLYIGPFFNTIKNKLEKKAMDQTFDEIMHLHVTEDMTLMSLLNLLQIKEPNAYEPGNGLIFELHYERDAWIVKFLVYDSRNPVHNLYEVVPGFVKTDTCPLSKLLAVTVTPSWEEACGFVTPVPIK